MWVTISVIKITSICLFAQIKLLTMISDNKQPMYVSGVRRWTRLSVSMYVRPHISGTKRQNKTFLCMLPLAMARSSSGGDVRICYVLPVLWLTSRLSTIVQTNVTQVLKLTHRGVAPYRRRSLMSKVTNALLHCVATHGIRRGSLLHVQCVVCLSVCLLATSVAWALQTRMNRSTCRFGLARAQETTF